MPHTSSMTVTSDDRMLSPARQEHALSYPSPVDPRRTGSMTITSVPPVVSAPRLRLHVPGDQRYQQRALATATATLLEDDDEWYSTIPGFQGLYGTGATEAEALADLREALAVWVQVRLERGLPLPAVE